jgi:hypothetical protein
VKRLALAALILAILPFSGCKKAEVDEPSAKIVSFLASAYVVPVYEPVTLSWEVINSTMVMISEIGLVDAVGSVSVNPQQSATYTLLAVGIDKETATRKLSITVDTNPACSGLQVAGSTGVAQGMQVEVGPNTNKYYSAKSVIVEARLFDAKGHLMEVATGIIQEIPPGRTGSVLVRMKNALKQARSEIAIIGCSCDFARPNL